MKQEAVLQIFKDIEHLTRSLRSVQKLLSEKDTLITTLQAENRKLRSTLNSLKDE